MRFGGQICIITNQDRRRAFPEGNPARAETPDGRVNAAEVALMLTGSALNSILGLYIILVLVLVVLVPKQNSAFGHARNKGEGLLPSGN